VELVIRGTELPGRRCPGGPGDRDWWENVHVGLQVRRDPVGLVPGDAPSAEWTTEIRLVESDGATDARGPAVQGPKGDRFVYLTWGDVDAAGRFTMVRRSKLMLAPVLAAAPARAVAVVRLTDARGFPRAARLQGDAVRWEFVA
jgi:hypothetical protein